MKKKIVRMTHQRVIIMEELKKLKTHPTADELYEIVRKRLPRISLATVYRNLDALAEMGMIQRIEVSGRQKRYDGNPDRHHHVRCIVCGRVADADVMEDLELDLNSVQANGFKILGYNIEFEGVCENCNI